MRSEFKIEKNIPIPRRRGGFLQTMREMEIGDSVLIPLQVRNSVSTTAKRLNIELTSKKINDKEVRVWRVR
jgi:hypothetical protein